MRCLFVSKVFCMRSSPGLRTIHHSSNVTEYHALATSTWSFWTWLAILSMITMISQGHLRSTLVLSVFILWMLLKCRCVIHESIISLPPHGVQLETHRGLPSTPLTPPIILFINRQFIPLPSIKDIIIHEGLYGWNVRYYLAVICTTGAGGTGGTGGTGTNEEERRRIAIRVVFENILPKFPILKEVYLKLRKDLLPD